MRELEGAADGTGLKVALVVSRFHSSITDALLRGALARLAELGTAEADVTVVHVPGALELPQAALRLAGRGGHDALVVLGCVIRGETDHYDFVCAETTRGCGRVGAAFGLPVMFGLLTCDSMAQARARSGPDADNKGGECAEGAVRMARLFADIDASAES